MVIRDITSNRGLAARHYSSLCIINDLLLNNDQPIARLIILHRKMKASICCSIGTSALAI